MELTNSASVEALGLIAGAFLICAFLPQVIKVLRTRSARDLSLLTFLLQSTGVVLWIVYGLITGSLALVITNSLTMIIYITLIYLILRYRNAPAPTK